MPTLEGMDLVASQWRRAQDALAGLQRFFIVGCGKSGTTWLRNLLAGHPQIAVEGEGAFVWRLTPLLRDAIRAFNRHQLNGQPAVTQWRDADFLLLLRLAIDHQLGRYVAECGKDVAALRAVGDKTPQHSIGVDLLTKLYPRAKFVHIMRDPRDVATSAWFHSGVKDGRTFEEYVRHFIEEVWPLQVGAARQSGRRLGAQRYLEFRYRDLLADEPGMVARLLRFLGVDAAPQCVEACLEAGDFERLSGGRRRGECDPRSFFRRGIAGDWVNHIPRPLASECCSRIAPLMRECGFDPGADAATDS